MELCKLLHTFATHDFVIYSDAPSAHEVTQCNIKKKIIPVHDTIRDSMFFHLMHQLCILYLVPPRHPQCTQCSRVKYNVDKAFKANAN